MEYIQCSGDMILGYIQDQVKSSVNVSLVLEVLPVCQLFQHFYICVPLLLMKVLECIYDPSGHRRVLTDSRK